MNRVALLCLLAALWGGLLLLGLPLPTVVGAMISCKRCLP